MGLVDSNGDGVRERPDGRPLAIRIVFANQGSPSQLHELTRGYWSDVGVQVDIREVTSDEYRSGGNNNDLDVTIWKNDGITGPFISQDATMLVPPFGDFFNPGTGHDWATWRATDGAEGVEPPAYIKALWPLAEQFLQEPLGTAESTRIGGEIIDIHVDNLLKIGIVGDVPSPYVYDADLGNVRPMTAKTYDFYWAYPYRPQQWFFRN
jgi:peptide/nickel transport system substrate-binding protein